MNKLTAGLIVGYSLPFGNGYIKSCAHVLHDVSITVVKKQSFIAVFINI